MANERPAAAAADKPGGKPAHRSRHRSGRPGRSATGVPAAKSGQRWTWREYILQLSVVILGIVVTFAGSGLIDRWQQARQARSEMQYVYKELKQNCLQTRYCVEKLIQERNGMLMFARYGGDVARIPTDSLCYYGFIWSFREPAFMHAAVDGLKLSGNLQSVDDELKLQVFGCYEGLDAFARNVADYNRFKRDALKHYYSEGIVLDFGSSDPVEAWNSVLKDRFCNNFIRTSAYYFGRGDYLWHDIAGVERTIAAINEKYSFQ